MDRMELRRHSKEQTEGQKTENKRTLANVMLNVAENLKTRLWLEKNVKKIPLRWITEP